MALEWGKTLWLKGANWVMGKFRLFQCDAYRIYKQPLLGECTASGNDVYVGV